MSDFLKVNQCIETIMMHGDGISCESKFNYKTIYINPNNIEQIEEDWVTLITMSSGKIIYVKESYNEIIGKLKVIN